MQYLTNSVKYKPEYFSQLYADYYPLVHSFLEWGISGGWGQAQGKFGSGSSARAIALALEPDPVYPPDPGHLTYLFCWIAVRNPRKIFTSI